jgi:cation diffusion facilitator CzcD-associated flavoprotein CzcO
MTTTGDYRVCVVGAGAAGLCCVKHMSTYNFQTPTTVVVLEQNLQIGGTWLPQTIYKQSACYEHLVTNTSKSTTEFEGEHPHMNEEWPENPSHDKVLLYLQRYAEHHNLMQYIRFGCTVKNVNVVLEDKWSVQWICNDTIHEEVFDYVCICNGHYSDVFTPTIKGLDTFTGTVVHSRDYVSDQKYKNKRVLIVGMGTSGSDIADYLEAKNKVKYIERSTRQLPKTSTNPPSLLDRLLGKAKYPIFRPSIRHVDGNLVTFIDDTSMKCDTMILCTGYNFKFDFLPQQVTDLLHIRVNPQCVTLYLHMFHPKIRHMVFLGICSVEGSVFPVLDAQCRLLCRLLDKTSTLPCDEEINKQMENFDNRVDMNRSRKPLMVNPERYARSLDQI